MKTKLGSILIFAFFIMALAGCETEYSKAQKVGTSQAYNDYLSKNPDSSNRTEALQKRDEALWNETVAANTVAAYTSFIQKNRKNGHVPDARKRAHQLLAAGSGGEDEYADFLALTPAEPNADDVRQGLEKVRFNALQQASDPGAYAVFVGFYPGTPDAEKISPLIRKHDFKVAEKMGTRLAYEYFLKRYPSSQESDKARAHLNNVGSAAEQQGGDSDASRLLPRLRRSSPALIRRECQKSLEAKLRQQTNNIFASPAEELRDKLKQVAASGENPPELCANERMTLLGADRQTIANAVRALARLMERQQDLGNLFAGPEKITHDAVEIGERAASMSEDSESQELELEALYGNMPADPLHPEDTASKNAKEASKRAKHAWDLARTINNSDKKGSAADVLRLMDKQTDLLLDIIADNEKPAAVKNSDDSQNSAE
jgi:hypothetical protein